MICRALISLVFGITCTVGLAWVTATRDVPESSALLFSRALSGPRVVGPSPRKTTRRILIPSSATICETRLGTHVRAYGPTSLMRCGNSNYGEPEQTIPEPPPAPPWEPLVPTWATDSIRPSMCSEDFSDIFESISISVDARGWPCRALCSVVTRKVGPAGPTTSVERGISVGSPKNSALVANRGYGVVLPYGPIWSGLVVNMFVFGVPAWFLLSAVPLARRSLRVRRNHCPKCNYNLHGLIPDTTCPECGRTPARHRP